MKEKSKEKVTIPTDKTRKLINKIPLKQRKKIVKNSAYRKGWLDSTFFWYQQINEIFDKWANSIACRRVVL
ncbi:MAG: hypothetical protein EHM34_09935 [Nitrosopumilales archaeon]|jgi:hypothetical protein|nr:MAG: hypothetical protein EHM34_09935 [Nitrosopumilales archaeon]